MKNNLFSYAITELSQDAFLCWCLNWFNDPAAPLFPMAAELMALLGEGQLPVNQELDIRQQIKNIDILVNLKGQNRILIIEDKTTSSEHDDQIAMYREKIQSLSPEEQVSFGVDSSVDIRTIYFKTGFYYDRDKATVADIKNPYSTIYHLRRRVCKWEIRTMDSAEWTEISKSLASLRE